jgi:tetraacyldisaccharide 4'-kinase
VGGSGKTSMAIEIAKILRDNYKSYCFLTRGYGGNNNARKILRVNEYNNSPHIVGDEALLLFEYGDTFVSRSKVRGLKYIDKHYDYDYVIVDDGLQNPTFIKSKKILVLNCEYESIDDSILPAGPLRESFSRALRRGINLVVLIGKDKNHIGELCAKHSLAKIQGTIEPVNSDLREKYIAICGIGHPEKFRGTLEENGVEIEDFIVFDDHHSYQDSDLEKIKKTGHNIITTKKDWVKIKNLNINKNKIHVLDIYIDFDDRTILERALISD